MNWIETHTFLSSEPVAVPQAVGTVPMEVKRNETEAVPLMTKRTFDNRKK